MPQYGLIGERLGHSRSPWIHERLHGEPYALIELRPEALGEWMAKRDFSGINVTIPYKKAVIPHLDELTPEAREVMSVNTIVHRGGRLIGHNTDGFGFERMLRRAGISADGAKACVLGSGGTGVTAASTLRRMGAREVLTVSRLGPLTYEDFMRNHRDAELIVNATPVGMFPAVDDAPIELSGFEKLRAVADVIYNPLRSRLMLDAQARGVRCANGLYMLIEQARRAAEFFLDRPIAGARSESIYREMVESLTNIVLIGMPGCGKTRVGQALAERLNRPFIDVDQRIEESEGRSIEAIFAAQSEAYFREVEARVLKEIAPMTGAVIATGGGSVLDIGNARALQRSGALFLIERPVDELALDGRPLSGDRQAVRVLYEKRMPIYRARADAVCLNDAEIDAAVSRVEAVFHEIVGD